MRDLATRYRPDVQHDRLTIAATEIRLKFTSLADDGPHGDAPPGSELG